MSKIERRRNIEELYEKGLKYKDIAKKLKISIATVSNDIKILKARGRIFPERNEITQRREDIKKLYQKGIKYEDIAKKLKINLFTVSNDIKILKKQGRISSKRKEITQRRKNIEELYEKGEKNEDIAKKLKINLSIVNNDIRILKQEGKISSKKREKKQITQRKENIKKLYQKGIKYEDIAKKLKINLSTVNNDIRILKQKGKISSKKREKKQITQRRKNIEELYEKGIKNEDIAEKLKINLSTVNNDIRILKQKGKISSEKKQIIQTRGRRKRIKKLYEKEEKVEDIAKKSKVSLSTVNSDIQSSKVKRIGEYIKECIHKGKIQEAADYANTYKNHKMLSEKQRENLKKLIILIEERQIKQIKKLYNQNKTIEQIIKITGYAEGIVYRTCQKMNENEFER